MKINWKVRLRNKTFWVTIIPSIVTIVYTLLGFFGVVPQVSQNDIINLLLVVVGLFSAFGCFVDPTTSGASDSEKALTYEKPAPSSTTLITLISSLLKRGVKGE
jgi:phi LC3 family holin